MHIAEVKQRAAQVNVRPGRARKADLIRTIQTAEGNNSCFGTAENDCDQIECCWREDCLKA
jgi:hypothetical protein